MREKRSLPRHVDGRIKIGLFPIKKFFFWLPFPISLIFILINNFSPPIIFICIIGGGLSAFPFIELRHRRTGLDVLKELIFYDFRAIFADMFPKVIKHKVIKFERSGMSESAFEKFTYNKKVHEIIKKQKEQQQSDELSH